MRERDGICVEREAVAVLLSLAGLVGLTGGIALWRWLRPGR